MTENLARFIMPIAIGLLLSFGMFYAVREQGPLFLFLESQVKDMVQLFRRLGDNSTERLGLPPSENLAVSETGEPRVDLEHPSERDWAFLMDVLQNGTPEGRRSAARALVAIGDLKGVEPLFDQATPGADDAAFFCLAALEILRLQRQEDAVATLVLQLMRPATELEEGCRIEISDRLRVAGGQDPDVVSRLASHEDPRIRSFVAGYLFSIDSDRFRPILDELAKDPNADVRARAGGVFK